MLIRAFWQREAIDQLGLLLLPVLFGEGLPLFPLDEGEQKQHPDGSMELFYERA